MRKETFAERAVIITGAASGIGKALALQLARRGAWLALADIQEGELERVGLACKEAGGRAIALPVDITRQDECQRLVDRTAAQYQRLDMLVNNAGITMWGNFEDLPDFEYFSRLMAVNFWGSVYCTYYALPRLKTSQGRIVTVASLAGKSGLPTRTAYSASKHALVGFFDALRIELAPHGISVTVVFPGFVATGLRFHSQRLMDASGLKNSPSMDHLWRSPVNEKRAMRAEQCAQRIIRAAAKRKREEVMTARGMLGQWLKLIVPAWVDRMASRAVARGQ